MTYSFIFFGDSHGFLNDFEKLKEIIEKYYPEFILSEQMQDISLINDNDYNKILKTKYISEMISFDELKDLILLCKKRNIKLIGIDFKNFGFNNRFQKMIKEKIKPRKNDEKEIEKIVKKRELYQLNKIKSYNLQKNVLVTLGVWHLRKDSPILKELNNYILIYPSNERGEIIMEPPSEKTKIIYSEKYKNE